VLRRTVLILLDVLIGLHIVVGVAVLWTAELHIEIWGATLQTNSVGAVLMGLLALVYCRILVRSGWKIFALLCASTACALIMAEAVLRIVEPALTKPNLIQIHRASDRLDWELVPYASGVGEEGELIRINSAGMRDREYSREKPRDTLRIAAVGDSFTFGMGVDVEDTYVRQLQQLLEQDGVTIEIMNFGVIAYGMWQFEALLEEKILPYAPDAIVLGLFLDDLGGPEDPRSSGTVWHGRNPFESLIRDETTASYLLNFLSNANRVLESKYRHRRGYRYLQGIEERKREIGPQNPEHTFYALQTGSVGEAVYRRFTRALGRFVRHTRQAGVPVVVAYIPDASQLNEADRQYANRAVARAVRLAEVPFVDLTPRFERAPDPRELYLFPLDAHTSKAGHRMIAEAVAELLHQAGLVEK